MTIIALLSGLAGSIITIVLEKLIDYFTLKEQNEHELKKAFYERKLRTAEAAVSHWTKLASAVGLLSSLYDKFSEDEELNLEVFQDLEESFTSLLNEANQSKNEFSSAILLYFDINEEEFWNSESVKVLFENLSALRFIFQRGEKLESQRSELHEFEDEDIIRNIDTELNRLGKRAKEHIKEISDVYSEAQEITKDLVQKIRKEMKSYEYQSIN